MRKTFWLISFAAMLVMFHQAVATQSGITKKQPVMTPQIAAVTATAATQIRHNAISADASKLQAHGNQIHQTRAACEEVNAANVTLPGEVARSGTSQKAQIRQKPQLQPSVVYLGDQPTVVALATT